MPSIICDILHMLFSDLFILNCKNQGYTICQFQILFQQILRKPITDAFLATRPLAGDNLVKQMNDPKLQNVLGMYIAAMKNK